MAGATHGRMAGAMPAWQNRSMSGDHLVWFKHDLRCVDHRPLARAAAQAMASGDAVVPIFVVEPELWRQPDMAGRHWAFVAEALAQLRADLAALGQPLLVRQGDMRDLLSRWHAERGLAAVYAHQETGNGWTYARDRAVRAWCRQQGVPFDETPQTGVIRGLKSRDGWAAKWDRFMAEPVTPPPAALPALPDVAPGPIPTAAALDLADDPCPGRQTGGRAAALATLESFLDHRGERYRRAMSSPVTGFDQCSRISPYLSWGCVSMREVAQRTWAAQRAWKGVEGEAAKHWRQSLNSFSGRLHWHCHFAQKLEDDPRIEIDNLHRGYDGLRPDMADPERLAAWAEGRTGLPFVDACMRALRHTGYLNFRMRAMVQAVATYHLWLPWRDSGLVLARLFTDYDPGIHWSQSQMQAGTTGINTVRIYNPVKQGHDQDPDGVFVRRWVPELAPVPDAHVQEPWRWADAETVLGRAYPDPIVDHKAAAKDAKQAIYAVRRSAAFKGEADAIQSKHGSRRSGLPNRGQRPRRGRKFDSGQGSFEFDDG